MISTANWSIFSLIAINYSIFGSNIAFILKEEDCNYDLVMEQDIEVQKSYIITKNIVYKNVIRNAFN